MNKRVYNALRKVAGLLEDAVHIRDGWDWSHLIPWSSPSVPAPTPPIPSAVARHNKFVGHKTLEGRIDQGQKAVQKFVDDVDQFQKENPDIQIPPAVTGKIKRYNGVLQRWGEKAKKTVKNNQGLEKINEKINEAGERTNWWGFGGNK